MRQLHLTNPPEHGADVRELQQLLGVAVTGTYDTSTANAVYRKKLLLGYSSPDHAAGELLMAYMKGKKKPSATMVKRAAVQRKALAKAASAARPQSKHATVANTAAAREAEVRAAAVSLMHFLFAENRRVHYPPNDVRTMTIHHISTRAQLDNQLAQNLSIDCSQAMTLIAHVAGAKDPNGHGYAEDGFTGTLLHGCQAITRAQARPGDMRIFGRGTGHHVCMVIAPGGDPLLFSHGQEAGPLQIRESVESKFQPSGGTFLRLPL
jgi:hypothetical protein